MYHGNAINIGALPRRCRPQVTRIGAHGALHSRSALLWRFNRSLAPSRQFRSPSTGLAEALDLGNLKPLGYDFLMLWDFRIVNLLSCAHGKLYPGSATPRRLPRSLSGCVASLTAHILHAKLIWYHFAALRDCMIVILLSCTHDKPHPGSATTWRLPRSLTCCIPSLTAPAVYLELELILI